MRTPLALIVFGALVIAACGGDDDASETPTPTPDESTDESASTTAPPAETTVPPTTQAPETTAAPTTVPLTPEEELQAQLLDAQPGDVIEIPAGVYSFERSLSLEVDGVTIRGAGIDETILSFADQVVGAEGLLVSASDFTIEHLAIEDTIGDALKINEGENIIIRGVRTEWTGGYSVDNGAYGIYPVQTSNVLIEDSVAIGASDAGIYVGQSNDIIVRNNFAEYNVAGIEIENSIGADVYGNLATNNTGGILVFNMPGLPQRGSQTRVYDNDIIANNTENFSIPGTAVSVTPAGSGVVIMANDSVEIFDNRIADNGSGNVVIASSYTVGIGSEGDPEFDGYPQGIYIHDNEFSGGGDNPDSIVAALYTIAFPDGDGTLPDIVWDGAIDETKLVDGEQLPENRICVQEVDSEVINADAANGFANPVISIEEYDCAHEPLPAVELPGA